MAKSEILHLYKLMLRESQKFNSYNYRTYAIRRIRDAFKENKGLENQEIIEGEIKKAQKNLGIIQRQAIIGNLFKADKLIIEQ